MAQIISVNFKKAATNYEPVQFSRVERAALFSLQATGAYRDWGCVNTDLDRGDSDYTGYEFMESAGESPVRARVIKYRDHNGEIGFSYARYGREVASGPSLEDIMPQLEEDTYALSGQRDRENEIRAREIEAMKKRSAFHLVRP